MGPHLWKRASCAEHDGALVPKPKMEPHSWQLHRVCVAQSLYGRTDAPLTVHSTVSHISFLRISGPAFSNANGKWMALFSEQDDLDLDMAQAASCNRWRRFC